MTTRPRISVPPAIKANDVIEVKTVITHVMETGLRKDKDGAVVPRNIINSVTAQYNGKTVFTAELHPSTSANPFISFQLKVTAPGELVVTWTDDAGQTASERTQLLLL